MDAAPRSKDADVQIYLSYSHRDRKLVDEFRAQMQEQKLPAKLFYDMDLRVGQTWDDELRRNLAASQAIIVFLSPDALEAEYILRVEVPFAMEMHKKGQMLVIPILLRDCAWQKTPIAAFQILPRDLAPVADARPRMRAWARIIDELRSALASISLPSEAAVAAAPLPPGPDRLRLALYGVLEQPEQLDLLDCLDSAGLEALWRQRATDGETLPHVLQALARRLGEHHPHPLWAAWVQTVQPDKLG